MKTASPPGRRTFSRNGAVHRVRIIHFAVANRLQGVPVRDQLKVVCEHSTMNDVTRILSQLESGDPSAGDELLPLVYDELRKLAAAQLTREQPGQTLQATALVHEAWLRLVGSEDRESAWASRGHFFAAAATAMRRILIERARRRHRIVHGGGRVREELPDGLIATPETDDQMLALDAALTRLAECDPEKARLVDLRYFAGLTGDQTAVILGISPKTADRYWAYARAWLRREMDGGDEDHKNS
jgi:RNA polymerase sigma factor (TIGR02999 family)